MSLAQYGSAEQAARRPLAEVKESSLSLYYWLRQGLWFSLRSFESNSDRVEKSSRVLRTPEEVCPNPPALQKYDSDVSTHLSRRAKHDLVQVCRYRRLRS